jgi:hypothetical protein
MINSVKKEYFINEFTGYKMTLSNGTAWSVPLDEANTDYQAIQEWVAIEGNEIIDNGGSE